MGSASLESFTSVTASIGNLLGAVGGLGRIHHVGDRFEIHGPFGAQAEVNFGREHAVDAFIQPLAADSAFFHRQHQGANGFFGTLRHQQHVGARFDGTHGCFA